VVASRSFYLGDKHPSLGITDGDEVDAHPELFDEVPVLVIGLEHCAVGGVRWTKHDALSQPNVELLNDLSVIVQPAPCGGCQTNIPRFKRSCGA